MWAVTWSIFIHITCVSGPKLVSPCAFNIFFVWYVIHTRKLRDAAPAPSPKSSMPDYFIWLLFAPIPCLRCMILAYLYYGLAWSLFLWISHAAAGPIVLEDSPCNKTTGEAAHHLSWRWTWTSSSTSSQQATWFGRLEILTRLAPSWIVGHPMSPTQFVGWPQGRLRRLKKCFYIIYMYSMISIYFCLLSLRIIFDTRIW